MDTLKTLLTVIVLAGATILAGCQSEFADTPGLADGDTGAAADHQISEYRLGTGDKLRVTVYGEPDLSGEFSVDGTGDLSMPLVGEVPAADYTVREVRQTIAQSLESEFLVEPRVSAEVVEFRPFYILGEVNKPGAYPYSIGLTALNAVATAEGFTYRANTKRVFIKREGETAEYREELTPDLIVRPGDTIRVTERFF